MSNETSAERAAWEHEKAELLYCPTCNSCGESGCCDPSKCQAVKCLFGEENIKSYQELSNEIEQLEQREKQLVEIWEGLIAVVNESGGIAGWHLNGDVAEWSEFEFVNEARSALTPPTGEIMNTATTTDQLGIEELESINAGWIMLANGEIPERMTAEQFAFSMSFDAPPTGETL